MKTPSLNHRNTTARWLSGVQLVAMIFTLSILAGPGRADIGHWTPTSRWAEGHRARYAVHMLLMRGDNHPFHSHIVWFQGEAVAQGTLYGGDWGWTPGGDDYTQYPTSHFVRLGIDPSGMNPFCAGQAMLGAGNGGVLVAGGDDPEVHDYGEIRARIFTGGVDTLRGTWSDVPDMHYRRFYPTVTGLGDGRCVVLAGDAYRQHWIFGDLVLGDTLRRFAPIPGGRWDPSVIPAQDPAGKPTPRYGHTAVEMEYVQPFGGQVYFGGEDAQGFKKNDTWFLRLSNHAHPLLADGEYSWVQPTIGGGAPDPRTDHSAIVALDTCMVIFGGLGTSTVYDDVWRLFYDRTAPATYRWKQIVTFDTGGNLFAPPARLGHSAIYDQTVGKRMIVVGGTPALDESPTDLKVWELRFDHVTADTATWVENTPIDLGDPKPGPRYWATLSPGTNSHTHSTGGPGRVALMFGGKVGTSACSDTLWGLWIFTNGTFGWQMKRGPGGDSPSPRARHSAVFDPGQSLYDGRLYIYGGVDGGGDPTDSHEYVLDPWGGQDTIWTQWSDLGVSLAGHTAVREHDQQRVRTAEVFSLVDTLWHEHSYATLWERYYPPVFLVPGGGDGKSRLLNVGGEGLKTYSLDIPPAGESATESWEELASGSTGIYAQSGVQYRPGHILLANDRGQSGATRTFDALNPGAGWVPSGSMLPRKDANLVLLPTGNVLAVGGNEKGAYELPVRWPQMWDPDGNSGAGRWSSMTDPAERLEIQPTIRPNHSTAILLPDGRVLSAGGDGDNIAYDDTTSDQHTGDIFYPPYLFQADGSTLAERPTFSNSAKPESLGFGKVFTICVPATAGITRACLIRPGATTHAVDMNQRYVPLLFTKAENPPRLLVTSPASPDSAPPGDYMLFITGKTNITGNYPDVPSIAKWVRVVAPGLDSCDVVPPDVSDDLTADCDPDVTNGWALSWLAPGDDDTLSASGPASAFEMRKSSNHITDSNFSGASLMSTPVPEVAGWQHTLSTTVGNPGKYIRLRTRDDNNQNSGLSDEVYIFPWSSEYLDCYGGEGMTGGGGGEGGYSAGRAPGFAALRSEAEPAIPENSLLPGARTGEKSRDAWRLASGLKSAKASYSVRIRERAGRGAALDRVRLVAVDHAPGLEALSVGGAYATGERKAAARVTAGDGSDLTAVLDGSAAYTAVPGETLSVDLGPGGGASPLVVEVAGQWPCGLELLIPDGKGGWQSRGRLQPRRGMDALPLTPPGSDVIQLAVLGQVSLKFVGSLATSGEPPTVQSAALASAASARLGEVSTAVGGSDNLSATLAGPDTLALSFEAPPLEAGQVRDCFLEVEATPVSGKTLAALQRAVETPSIPTRFALRQNRPNPFNATTTVWFDLPVGAMVRLEVFDAQGRRVGMLANRYFPPGSHAVPWNPSAGGRHIGPGVYFYRLEAGAFHDRRKMTLLP